MGDVGPQGSRPTSSNRVDHRPLWTQYQKSGLCVTQCDIETQLRSTTSGGTNAFDTRYQGIAGQYIDSLARLTHLGFECCSTDMLPRLEQWVSRVPKLISLSLHGTTNIVPLENPPRPAKRADVFILQALIAHPEWMPNLTDFQLTHCAVSDYQLTQFVHMRRVSPDMTPLTRLSMCSQKQLLPESHTYLHQAVIKRDGSGSGFSYTTRDRGGAGEDRCDCVG